jgi:hypothetical protein
MKIQAYATLGVLLALLTALPGKAMADYIWHPYQNHEYALTLNWQSWVSNEAEAQSIGGHLVAINNAEENAWLTSTFANTFLINEEGFAHAALANIGYYLEPSTGQWHWSNGDPVTYTNYFARPETGQFFPEGGAFGYLHVFPHAFAGTWHGARHVDGLGKGIIERPLVPVAEPSTLLLLAVGLAAMGLCWKQKGSPIISQVATGKTFPVK